jgi:hypothetical protein
MFAAAWEQVGPLGKAEGSHPIKNRMQIRCFEAVRPVEVTPFTLAETQALLNVAHVTLKPLHFTPRDQ